VHICDVHVVDIIDKLMHIVTVVMFCDVPKMTAIGNSKYNDWYTAV